MEQYTFIEVEDWGDFDVRYTKAILYTAGKRDVKYITKTFCELKGLPSTDGLPYDKVGGITDDFIEYLKKKEGFSILKTNIVYFSD